LSLALSVIVLIAMFESGCRSRHENHFASDHPEAGIPLALAQERAESIRDVRYQLSFSVPEKVAEPISGQVKVRFKLSDVAHPVVLDFEPGASSIMSVSSQGRPIAVDVVNGHIVIAKEFVTPGENSIEIAFRAGDASLNRNPDFMYAL